MLEIGTLVDGKYKILNEIGHGGMSIVYLAIVERANQTWAIKEVRKNGATKEDIVQQGLVAEMNILKRLNHPHLPRIIDIIDYKDSFLIVMDYIEGVDLDKKLRDGPQKWEDVVEWTKQLCDVLAYLHSRTPPIIYRDMKPGNVKLKPDGNIVLFDFGTAREYKSQKAGDDTTCLGTRGYASPEQYGGMGQTDARSDIYCLGATMFHLVTGRIPGGPPDYIIPPIRSICPWLPRSGEAGMCVRGLEQIIMKCVEPTPLNRYQSCAELMYDLEHIGTISGTFIEGLKKKLRGWAACVSAAVILGIASGALAFASTKTISNNYKEYLDKAGDYANASMSENIADYSNVKTNLKEAISINPSDPTAWIYLAQLYRSDHSVTVNEMNDMKQLLDSSSGQSLKKDVNAYAQFCFEWGKDLYFFYDSTGNGDVATVGDPEKAAPYLKAICAPEDGQSEEKLIERLINNNEYNYFSQSNFSIAKIDSVDAENEFDFAKCLYNISKQWGALGQSSLYDSGYSYDSYWSDIEDLMNSADLINSTVSTVNTALVKCSVYSNIANILSSKFSEFIKGSVSSDDISVMVDNINKKTSSLKSSTSSEIIKEIEPIINNITKQCENILTLCRSMS